MGTRKLTAQRGLFDAVPVIVVAAFGAGWIFWHAGGGRGQAHVLFQALALVENVVALLMRRRKPLGALAGVLAVYVLVDLRHKPSVGKRKHCSSPSRTFVRKTVGRGR